MNTLFIICASFGGTVLVLQFLMTALGLGGHGLGIDMPHDVGHSFDTGDHDLSGDAHDAGPADHSDGHSAHGSSRLFAVISFRTVIAAFAFFGLAGLAAQSADASDTNALGIAVAAGLAAMYGVYALMRSLASLRCEGTIRIQSAVGRQASVYLPIPAHDSGCGKIQINLQNRTMEYSAHTPGEAIPSGATVVVTEIINSDTVRVQTLTSSPKELPSC